MLPPFKLDLCRYDEGYTLKRMEMERVMALQGGTFYPSLFFFFVRVLFYSYSPLTTCIKGGGYVRALTSLSTEVRRRVKVIRCLADDERDVL